MVIPQPSKLKPWVRFPSPAPKKNGGAFMRANLDRAKAMEIAAKEGLEWEVQNTFKNLKKQFGKKVADSMLWSMALDEWDL